MRILPTLPVAALVAAVTLAGCGSSRPATSASGTLASGASTSGAPTAASTMAPASPTTASPVAAASAASPTTIAPATPTTAASAGGAPVVNTWVGPPVDVTKLPIGTAHVVTTGAAVGSLYACPSGPGGGGAFQAGPWIDEAAGTWDRTQKVKVTGDHAWPTAVYTEQVTAAGRVITSNGLPVQTRTGTFPIPSSDAAYAYDRNPNAIGEHAMAVTLPASPAAAPSPGCLGKGAIGIFRNGVVAFAAVDALNRDAAAYETQDACDGHPERTSVYHYHDVPSCLLDAATGPSTVVGFALDGFPIVVERDATGRLPTNADLDACHGRTSPVLLDGTVVTTYHYAATYEFPYYVGCYRGTPVAA